MSDNDYGVLPPTWGTAPIGDVICPAVDQSGPDSEETFVYVDISSIDNRAKRIVEPKRLPVEQAPSRARQRLSADDVLVSMTRPNLNAVALVPIALDEAIGSTGFHVLRTPWLIPGWLFYVVQTNSFVDAMSMVVQGALYPAVRPKDINSYRIPVAPLGEQRRIVAEIEKQFSRLDAAVAALKRAQANLKRYRAAVLKAACEGRLVPTEAELARAEGRDYETGEQLLQRILAERRARWELEQSSRHPAYEEAARVDPVGLPELPQGWVFVALDQVLVQALSNGHSVPSAQSGFPVLRLTALRNGYVDLAQRKTGAWNADEARPYRVEKGDFLVARGNGTLNLVGRGGLVQEEPDGVAYPDTLIRVRVNSDGVSPRYLRLVWDSREFRAQVERAARTTAGIYKINQQHLRRFAIPVPPIAEQQRIVAAAESQFSVVDELEAAVSRNLRRAERLRQAILKRAFEGRLVPQDPNDEPASGLLERIRSEREAVAASENGRHRAARANGAAKHGAAPGGVMVQAALPQLS